MAKIHKVHAREILDSRGNPTVEVEVTLDTGFVGRAGVPSGASTGAHEAHELRDGDSERYHGKGVQQAIKNIHEQIAPRIIGEEASDQQSLDERLLQLDGSKNKSSLGANAILGISMAAAKASAMDKGQWLYEYVGGPEAVKLPVPLLNVLNGGAHANNGLDVQEFMIAPVCGGSFREALRAGSEIFQVLKKELNANGYSTAVGDEGGFAPALKTNKEAMQFLCSAIEKAGYKPGEDVLIALDVASTELFKDGKYTWEGKMITSQELGQVYADWAAEFPLVSVEDGFGEDDWEGWINFMAAHGDKLQLVGDDLFVTNPERLKDGIERKAANALLVKVNQIGSLFETEQAVNMAQEAGFATVMSHRSGETEDVTIADLAVAMNCPQIKTGSPCRGERTAKYNQLLRIEENLGSRAQFWGKQAFKS